MRGAAVRIRFVAWGGPYPNPGDGVVFDTQPRRRYVIRERVERTARMRRTLFFLWLVELGEGDADPAPLHRCIRHVRNHHPNARPATSR